VVLGLIKKFIMNLVPLRIIMKIQWYPVDKKLINEYKKNSYIEKFI